MPFTPVPITSATAFPPLIRALYAAQADPPVGMLQLFTPVIGDSHTALNDSIQSSIGRLWFTHACDPGSTWMSIVESDTKELVAACLWTIVEALAAPLAGSDGDVLAQQPSSSWDPFWLPEGSELRRYAQLAVAEIMKLPGAKGKRHMSLQIMFTHPNHRRKGAATMLMKSATAIADALGIECWLQARPMAKPLYLQHGFEIMKEVLVVPHVDEKEKTEEWKKLEERYRSVTVVMRRSPKGI